jgi:hypothetical protein
MGAEKFDRMKYRQVVVARQKRRAKDPVLEWAGAALRSSRERAKAKNWSHTLCRDHIVQKAVEFCPLIGIKLDYSGGKLSGITPTIDRIDPSLGYEPNNIWIVSLRANRAKNDATLAELKAILRWRKSVETFEGS